MSEQINKAVIKQASLSIFLYLQRKELQESNSNIILLDYLRTKHMSRRLNLCSCSLRTKHDKIRSLGGTRQIWVRYGI